MFAQATKTQIILSISLVVILLGGVIAMRVFSGRAVHDMIVLSEVEALRLGLERFRSLNQSYPIVIEKLPLNSPIAGTEKLCAESFRDASVACNRTIMAVIPNRYMEQGNRYHYQSDRAGTTYSLQFTLARAYPDLFLIAGDMCATPDGIEPRACF